MTTPIEGAEARVSRPKVSIALDALTVLGSLWFLAVTIGIVVDSGSWLFRCFGAVLVLGAARLTYVACGNLRHSVRVR